VGELVANLKQAERRVAEFEARLLRERIPALLAASAQLGSVTAIVESIDAVGSSDDLRGLVTAVRDKVQSEAFVIALGALIDGKPAVIVATTESARKAGVVAGPLAKVAATVLGGGGGGRDDMAQGGGSDASKLTTALSAVADALRA
jgi:alanyl-tRNA synthetase